ncbi:MAG: FG-GAP repeat domain-containing protein [Planctomycetia bacterium]
MVFALLAGIAVGSITGGGPREAVDRPADVPVAAAITSESEAAIRGFCSDCHALPRPASFPKESWYKEVRQGYDLYRATGRSDLVKPVEQDAIRFFAASAPERLVVERAADREEPPSPVRFEADPLPEELLRKGPALAQVLCAEGGGVLTTDMRHGEVARWRRGPDGWSTDVLARVDHPCRLTVQRRAAADAESGSPAEARSAYLLADLGSFLPEDHDRGGVFAVSGESGDEPRRLVAGLSRVVEAIANDFDGDGRDDLLVAEFGWLSTGGLRLLLSGGERVRVRGPAGLTPAAARAAQAVARPAVAEGYLEQVLDARHGALGVRLADLDGDGRDDVVTAFAQEHETIDVWWNRSGGLEHECVLTLPDPSYGSSSFDVADLDGDGRLDIVHANGDTMDSGLAKPYHAIRRLLNRGAAGFEVEEVACMVGVCQVSAADVDLDGDQDIVASSLHPACDRAPAGTFDSLVWLEQVPGGGYRRHVIERDRCEHAAFAVTDVDGDGRPDIVAGCWRADDDDEDARPSLFVYVNRSTRATPASGAVTGR